MYDSFTALLNTPEKRRVAERLAEIEASDREACSHCGGEDCICCPIYLDRQKWQEPEEFFASSDWDYDGYEPRVDWVYDEDEWLEIPLIDLGLTTLTPTTTQVLDAVIKFIRNDIKNQDAKFEFDYKIVPSKQLVEVSSIFYIYD